MAIRQTKKISELNTLTSASLNTYVLGVDNGSTYKITLDVLEDAVINMVSRSTDLRLDSIESYTASANAASDLSSLNTFTSSQTTLNTAFTNGINGRLQTSSFNTFSASVHSEILAATNEQSLTHLVTTSSFNQYTQSISTGSLVNRLNIIESVTSSYETKGSGILSGSVSYTSLTNIPQGIVSQSTDLSQLNQFTQSIDSRVDNLELNTGSYLTSLNGAISSSSQLTASYDLRYEGVGRGILSGSSQLTSSFETIGRGIISSSAQLPNGLISGSSQLTASYDVRYAPSASYLTSLNGAISSSSQLTSSLDIRYSLSGSGGSTTIPDGTISGSSQLTSSLDTRYLTIGGDGVISGSSQLTSSYDTRYALSGSGGTIPGGTISGSAQITTLGFATTSSLNTLTASFNSFTASAQSVTTGSNSFNGTQTITGSLIITTGSFVGSQILANTSSLYLTSGSNMYVQNNGVVEITGSLIVSGTTRFATVGGDEGGEIEFGVPQTNTTLSTSVKADIYQNRFRIFDGNTNGVYVDLSKAPTGVNGELTWKASGIVNAGTFVQLDNIKATVTSSGQRGLSLATVSGTFSYNIGGNFGGVGVGSGGTSLAAQTLTTTPTTSIFGWGFGAQSETSTYILADITNSRAYRITLQINGSYLNNFISIERLH